VNGVDHYFCIEILLLHHHYDFEDFSTKFSVNKDKHCSPKALIFAITESMPTNKVTSLITRNTLHLTVYWRVLLQFETESVRLSHLYHN